MVELYHLARDTAIREKEVACGDEDAFVPTLKWWLENCELGGIRRSRLLTTVHLNTNTLIGFTEKRGKAWHYRGVLKGDDSTHSPGAIPAADVRRRLLNWQAVPAVPRRVAIEFPATVETMTHLNDQGKPVRWAVQQNRQ